MGEVARVRRQADAEDKTLRPVPFAVTNPERIPKQRYYDAEFFELERKYLWPHVWQMATRLEEIPNVGDWVEYTILGQSVIVVRTKDGIKAYHNACRHRGVQIAVGHGNCARQGFICPFHGWRWNIDGENTYVHEPKLFSPENLEAADINLVPCRVETWGGCAFINFDDDAAPLLECIKPFTEMHDPRAVEKLKVEWWYSIELSTNWKTAMEAFMEGFHVMRTHPQLHAVQIPETQNYTSDAGAGPKREFADRWEWVEAFITNMKVLGEGMGGMIRPRDWEVAEDLKGKVELPDDMAEVPEAWVRILNDEVTRRAREKGIPMPDLNALPPVSPDNFCFPHYFLLPVMGNMSSYRIRPLGPEKTLFELYSLILYPEDEERPVPRAPEPLPADDPIWPEIPRQDYSNLERQQRGLHAKGFNYMRLAKEVEGSISIYQRVIDGFLAGVDKETLVKAQQIACAPIDSPVSDVGFDPVPSATPGI